MRSGRLHRARTGLTALVAVIGLTFVMVPPAAQAAPNLEQVRQRVMDLEMRAQSADERYNEARAELSDIQGKLDALKRKAKRERRELRQILGGVDDLARATYTSGGLDTSLQVLLAEDPNEFLAQAAALDQVQRGQASALRASETTRLRLAQTEAAVADKEQAATRAKQRMREHREEARDRLAEARAILSTLEARELARLSRLEQAARRAALAAAAAASARIGSGVSPRVARVLRYALSQVGDRYVAAASGPSAYDCSGLTMSAWRQAGISLPHYSRSQYSVTRRIPLSQARPGDLVFYFGSGAHHVGLYIGGGKMVHAANPRSGVLVTNILGPWYSPRFSGIGRVVS
ncbi:MAG: NlpC/P60 family protein [Actinomycetota bacterium]